MFREIVTPKDNEQEFIEIASKLGLKKLYFLYDFDEYDEEKIKQKHNSLKNYKNTGISVGFIINQKNINKSLNYQKPIVVKSSDKDRFFIESKKARLIYEFEETSKNDYIHQRASGLNHTLCELARKNNVVIGFSYGMLFNKSRYSAPILIGRMMQNISLCQKYKTKTAIGSFSSNPYHLRSPNDVISIFTMLGMERRKINESLTSAL